MRSFIHGSKLRRGPLRVPFLPCSLARMGSGSGRTRSTAAISSAPAIVGLRRAASFLASARCTHGRKAISQNKSRRFLPCLRLLHAWRPGSACSFLTEDNVKMVLEVAPPESVEPDSTAERRVERSLGGGRRAPNPSSRTLSRPSNRCILRH